MCKGGCVVILQIKELTEELEDMILEKCRKNGIFVAFYSDEIAIDDENDIIFIPGGGRGSKDDPRMLVMLYAREKISILYEEYINNRFLKYEVVQISGHLDGLEKNELYEMISQYFEGDTEYFNREFAKNNPSSELYRVKVDFDRCEIYEK